MSDLIFLDSAIDNCIVEPEDKDLAGIVAQFKGAMEGLIGYLRSKIGVGADFGDLSKQITFYLHQCLDPNKAATIQQPQWVCKLDGASAASLATIKELIKEPTIRDLAMSVHNGYLGVLVEQSMLVKFNMENKDKKFFQNVTSLPSLLPSSTGIDVSEYKKLIEQ